MREKLVPRCAVLTLTALFAAGATARAQGHDDMSVDIPPTQQPMRLEVAWSLYSADDFATDSDDDDSGERSAVEDDHLSSLRFLTSTSASSGLGLQIALSRFESAQLLTGPEGQRRRGDVDIDFLDLGIYSVLDRSSRHPIFVYGGPGVASFDTPSGFLTAPREDGQRSDDALTLHAGIGVKLPVAQRVYLRPDAQVRWIDGESGIQIGVGVAVGFELKQRGRARGGGARGGRDTSILKRLRAGLPMSCEELRVLFDEYYPDQVEHLTDEVDAMVVAYDEAGYREMYSEALACGHQFLEIAEALDGRSCGGLAAEVATALDAVRDAADDLRGNAGRSALGVCCPAPVTPGGSESPCVPLDHLSFACPAGAPARVTCMGGAMSGAEASCPP